MFPTLLIFAIITIVIVTMMVSSAMARRRREELFKLATELGIFYENDPPKIHDQYLNFSPFNTGHSHCTSNLLRGKIGELDWEIFDFKYTTGSGKDETTHHVGVVAAIVPCYFPHLSLRAEGLFDKIMALAGFEDINFESEEFSRRYHVKCSQRKFAYDLIHPKMIEFLLSVQPRSWQMEGRKVLIVGSRRFSPQQIRETIKLIQDFFALVPPYVRQDCSTAGQKG